MTACFTTDIAAAPFIWVVPLALYLLTFVAVFRERPWVQMETLARFVAIVVGARSPSLLGFFRLPWYAAAPLNLALFVALTLLCHGELYRRRPSPYHLTEFYFWTSFGGVVGGVFAGLVAPYAFNNIYEYPDSDCCGAAGFAWHVRERRARFFARDVAPVCRFCGNHGFRLLIGAELPSFLGWPFRIAMVLLVGFIFLRRKQPAVVFAAVALVFRPHQRVGARLDARRSRAELLRRASGHSVG